MAQRTWQLLASRVGQPAAVNGATQIRAGVMRPEIVIPLAELATAEDAGPSRSAGYLSVATPVRIIRDPYFGLIGKVAELPAELQVLASGSKARVLQVELDSGKLVTVPRANVELIEE
jgi:hypothetical protein